MLKKYILALAILGLMLPGTTNCGLDLKHVVGYAAHGIRSDVATIIKSRLILGIVMGSITRYYLGKFDKITKAEKATAKKATTAKTDQTELRIPTFQEKMEKDSTENMKKMEEIRTERMKKRAAILSVIGCIAFFINGYRDLKWLFTPGQRIPMGFIGWIIGSEIAHFIE